MYPTLTIFVCLAAVCFLNTEQAAVQPACGPNAIHDARYVGCSDRHCPEIPQRACAPLEPLKFEIGCHCLDGFVIDRQRSGACVRLSECLPVVVAQNGPFEPNTRISAHGAPGQIGQAVGR